MDEALGLRIGDGSISSNWMARMWDVVVIAGRQYDLRDRKFYEAYEGHSWIALSRSHEMAKASVSKSIRSPSPVFSFRLRSASPSQSIRRRRNRSASTRSRSLQSSSGLESRPTIRITSYPKCSSGRLYTGDIPYSRNDGAWSFEADAVKVSVTTKANPS